MRHQTATWEGETRPCWSNRAERRMSCAATALHRLSLGVAAGGYRQQATFVSRSRACGPKESCFLEDAALICRRRRREETSTLRDPVLDRIEAELARIPGVTGAHVAGSESPSEIHLVSSGTRPPKQIARDAESLCAASFGIPIDHRIVSVVQLGKGHTSVEQSPAIDRSVQQRPAIAIDSPGQQRPAIDSIVLTTSGMAGSIKVVLRWPDDWVSEGDEELPPTREGRARAATQALLNALQPKLDLKGARVAVEHVAVVGTGPSSSVQVQVVYQQSDHSIPLAGAALVQDDIATASVRAALQALNRKLVA